MDVLEEIKRKINIVDLLKEYIELKKAGANWKAVCPFHSEKSPSFMVSEDKQIWHCFGCNQGGDIFGFVMRMEGLEFPEAKRLLAKRAGVVLHYENPAINSQRTKLLDILDATATFYATELAQSSEASAYIKERGLAPETVARFRLGFSPAGWDNLLRHLLSKGFKPDDMASAGVMMKKDDGSGYYDRFRGRIMFPIFNHNNEIVGFTARVLPQYDDGKMGKYINTPETAVYKKSEILYGLNFAKNKIKKEDVAVLVEGNMDVIALHQAGFANVVATSGTALTGQQTELLKRYAQNVIMSFDADSAGIAAALRGIDIAIGHGLNIRVFQMPKNPDGTPIAKDPDELVRQSSELWVKSLQNTRHIIDFYIDANLAKFNLSDPHETAQFCALIVSEINKLPIGAERALWRQKLSDLTRVPEANLKEMTSSAKPAGKTASAPAETGKKPVNLVSPEIRYLSLLLANPSVLAAQIQVILPEMLSDEAAREFYSLLRMYYNDMGVYLHDVFRVKLRDMGGDEAFLDRLLLLYDLHFDETQDSQAASELGLLSAAIKDGYLKEQRKLLEREMAVAERMGDNVKIAELLKKFQELN
jgi:DNA primase